MKKSLLDLINKSIFLRYKLPNNQLCYEKSCITHNDFGDDCFDISCLDDLSRVIYEGILYYSYDQYQLSGEANHQGMFEKAFTRKFKFNQASDEIVKLKLGVYGETLLYTLLKFFYKNETLVCRGYFYDIQKKSEVTGYDCFHLVQNNNNLELWFGETKFYQDGKEAVKSVFKNISKAISDDYLHTNFVTILQSKGNIKDKNSVIYKILDKWEKCVIDNLVYELNANNIKLVYPILITYCQHKNGYDDSIKEIITYINSNYKGTSFSNIGIDYSIFFILLPIDDVKQCKKQIIEWIDKKEPLMS